MRKTKVPKSLQGALWSVNVKRLDIDKDKEYITHQILMYGTLEEIRWLIRTYGIEAVRKTFRQTPYRIYTPPAFNFIKNSLLGLKQKRFDTSRYVAKPIVGNTHRN